MTANIMSHDQEIYKACGMLDCLGKPFTSQELWRCLMKYLTPVSRGTAQAAAQTAAQVEEDNPYEMEDFDFESAFSTLKKIRKINKEAY